MGEWVALKASDGFEIRAWAARPAAESHTEVRAALVVAPEIFGVNSHIRSVADRYAERGFLVLAPAYFDRYEPGFETGYSADDLERAKAVLAHNDWSLTMRDTEAAIAWLRSQTPKKIGIVGYCYGGSVAWLSACRVDGLSAAVGYYGRAAMSFKDEQPCCPVMMHFGADDAGIPKDLTDAFGAAHPEVPVFLYENAGHAFNRDVDPHAYAPAAAAQALDRTLEFFAHHLEQA